VHARHLYTVLVDPERCGWSRNALVDALAAAGIRTSVHFTALHLHSFYAERYGFRRGMFPHAEYVSDCTLSLPFSAATTDAEADRVVAVLGGLLRRHPR
jgi:dTDP-4-amino-4,6-dideoxygalactose transaminase